MGGAIWFWSRAEMLSVLRARLKRSTFVVWVLWATEREIERPSFDMAKIKVEPGWWAVAGRSAVGSHLLWSPLRCYNKCTHV